MDDQIKNKLEDLNHKLINSMTVIIGHVQIMIDGLAGELTEEQKRRLLKVKEITEQLTEYTKEWISNI